MQQRVQVKKEKKKKKKKRGIGSKQIKIQYKID